MCKRIVSLCLCFVLLMGHGLHVYAEESNVLRIATAEEFLRFAQSCRLDSYSQNLTVVLEADIDLSETDFTPVPIFSGSFDGNGHTISGLSVTADGSVQGLFRYLTPTAVVQDLSVSGQLHPSGSRNEIGAIAGQNAGQVLNCSFTGSVSGADHVGGIVGINEVTGIIVNCQVSGELHADHFVGGIAGENLGVIRSCTNNALINTTPQQNDIEISDITMDTLTNTEAANTVTDIGGIAGISSGVIRQCTNRGDVGYPYMGYNIGGIAGTQSGYIVSCESFGCVQGRKEVGGIVGQMEPSSVITHSEDTLQILQRQLDDLSGTVNQVSGSAQTNAAQIQRQLSALQDQTQTARDALETLLPDGENPQLPDADTILAARNALSSALGAMPGTMESIASATQTTVSSLTRDLEKIGSQINAMGQTLSGAPENLGGSFTDISDLDTPEDLTGKVEGCVNHGTTLADLNAGGIVGAMAMENDLDILEDWSRSGDESLNFEGQVRAVILNCENRGSITGKKQNAGGIVGWQALGLVKNSTNIGRLDCANGDYVGGIAGLSTGFIRSNYAKCEIQASTCVGGIAGSGTVVTDCLSQVKLLDSKEKVGAVLGVAAEAQEDDPICRNYYLCAEEDPGAIDGISYSGLAEAMDRDAFLGLEQLPAIFQTATVRFVFAGGDTTELFVPTGEALDAAQIPAVPPRSGCTGKWEGLEKAQLDNILFDMTFHAVYTSYRSVIASQQTREQGLPVLLVEGSFTESAAVTATQADIDPQLTKSETLVEGWQITSSEGGHTVRFLLPRDVDGNTVKLLCQDGNGWEAISFTQDESYLVFPLEADSVQLALVTVRTNTTTWVIAGIAAAVLLCLTAVLLKKKKKPAKA